MNIAALVIASLGILPLHEGGQTVGPKHVVAIQANSAEASGTLKIQSVVKYTTASDETSYLTNVVHKGESVEKRDAYVGTDLVYYGGSTATAWTSEEKTVTNVVGSVTNIVSVNEQTLTDADDVKGVWTNVAAKIVRRYETATAAVTNVTTVTRKVYTEHPFTNDVIDVTLAGGKYSSVTNVFIPGGSLVVSGTALGNGVVSVFTEE